MNHRPLKILFAVTLTVIIAIAALQSFGGGGSGGAKAFDTQDLRQAAKAGEITRAVWRGTEIQGELKDGTRFTTIVPDANVAGSLPIQETLRQANVKLEYASPGIAGLAVRVLAMLAFPLLIVGLVYFLVLRPATAGTPSTNARIERLERALDQAQTEINQLREALSAKGAHGLSS